MCLPVLLLMVFGAMELGRVFFLGVAVNSAAQAGATYGAQSIAKSSDAAGMAQAALDEDPSLTGLTANGRQFCNCGGGAEVSCTTTCSNKRVYAEVTTGLNFSTVVSYPYIPNPIVISSKAAMRAK